MKIKSNWFRSQIAVGIIFLLTVPTAEPEGILPQQQASGQRTQCVSPPQPQSHDSASQGQTAQPVAAQSSTVQTQSSTQTPVGTAVAPYEKPIGVAASSPAGAAIAPGKQRRARSILIRVAVVVGAAVAIGAIVALSRASPSRPN
ncbi:MAG: hypothetical protein ABSG96_27705 [Terracidiphilus sp.]|jgi:hypothetical protein